MAVPIGVALSYERGGAPVQEATPERGTQRDRRESLVGTFTFSRPISSCTLLLYTDASVLNGGLNPEPLTPYHLGPSSSSRGDGAARDGHREQPLGGAERGAGRRLGRELRVLLGARQGGDRVGGVVADAEVCCDGFSKHPLSCFGWFEEGDVDRDWRGGKGGGVEQIPVLDRLEEVALQLLIFLGGGQHRRSKNYFLAGSGGEDQVAPGHLEGARERRRRAAGACGCDGR
ncbi:hypothetical protein T484DRAFT_2093878 [Baffinella frigidus]|nr:hypothetical protein T484DRAFT_2093878 [Cryptophyta sp. CCMP2293]